MTDFDEWFSENYDILRRRLIKYGDDIVNDAYIKCYQAIENGLVIRNYASYFARVARNLWISSKREIKPTIDYDNMVDIASTVAPDDNKDYNDIVDLCDCDCYSEKAKTLFELYIKYKKSLRKLAAEVGVSKTNIHYHIAPIIADLRELGQNFTITS